MKLSYNICGSKWQTVDVEGEVNLTLLINKQK